MREEPLTPEMIEHLRAEELRMVADLLGDDESPRPASAPQRPGDRPGERHGVSEQPALPWDDALEREAMRIWRDREMGLPERVRRMAPDDLDRASGVWTAVVLRAASNLVNPPVKTPSL
jgi:hypothetical protein